MVGTNSLVSAEFELGSAAHLNNCGTSERLLAREAQIA